MVEANEVKHEEGQRSIDEPMTEAHSDTEAFSVPPAVKSKPTNALSTAGLVCGIVGVVIAFIPLVNFVIGSILGILAIVFGAVAKKQDGSGVAAIILGAVTLGILILFVIIVFVILVIGSIAESTTF